MSFESPVSILFNTEGTELAVSESQAVTSTQPGLVIFGSGSTGFEYLRLSDSGELFVTGAVAANLSPNTPVSQGNPGGIADAWNIKITDGTQVLGTGSSAPIWISGAVDIPNTVTITGSVGVTSIASPVTIDTTTPLNVTGTVGVTSIASTVTTQELACTTTTVTGFGASTTNVTVLPSNTSRCGATFYMEGNANAFLKLGAGANTTGSYTVKLGTNGFFELPERYTGQIDVVFDKDDAAKILRVTEINE